MEVRQFRLLGTTALERVRARAATAGAAWAGQWGIDAAVLETRCAPADADLAGVAWDGAWHAGTRQLWLHCADGLVQQLQHAMFGNDASHVGRAPAPPQLAPQAASRARDALGAALATALLGEGACQEPAAQPKPSALAHGAGSVLVSVRIGTTACRVLLDSASVEMLAPVLAPQQAPLAPVAPIKALAATPVRLPVRVGQAELGLGTLMSVSVGDVIRLDRAIDAPVEVLGPQGTPLLRGYLGQLQGMVAIDVDSRP